MATGKGRDHRRGLFLALEALAGAPAVLLDAGGSLEHGNRQACDLLECGDDGLEARWKAIAPHFDLPPKLPFTGKPQLHHADIPFPARSRPVSLEIHALDEGAGHGYFAILKDRGVLDHFERELFLASERRGWGHQCATLMHDLKGILNSMQISLELLVNVEEGTEFSAEEARRQRRIATLKEDLSRMNLALRGLPGSDGNAEPVISEFDAGELIRENFTILRQLVRRNSVELRLDLPQAPLPARGRRPWLKVALFNVAVHRLNAMRAGGRLVVDAAMTDQGAVVKLSNDVPDMRDGDPGHRYSCSTRGNGSATDLQVARALLESQGGSMEIESGKTDSTVFVLRLPH